MRNALEAMAGMDRRKLLVTMALRRPDLVEFAVAEAGLELARRWLSAFSSRS